MDMLNQLLNSMTGVSVTQRIKQVKQPRGGYIKPKELTVVSLGDGAAALNPVENVHASLMGLAVDYMTRFMTGAPATDAFAISLMGAQIIGEMDLAQELLAGIKGLDDESIVRAVKLSGFDVCFRAGIMGYKPVQNINPDADTIANVRVMESNKSICNDTFCYGSARIDCLLYICRWPSVTNPRRFAGVSICTA